jgi:hypothetical protein
MVVLVEERSVHSSFTIHRTRSMFTAFTPVLELPNCRTAELPNCRTAELPNCRTAVSDDAGNQGEEGRQAPFRGRLDATPAGMDEISRTPTGFSMRKRFEFQVKLAESSGRRASGLHIIDFT